MPDRWRTDPHRLCVFIQLGKDNIYWSVWLLHPGKLSNNVFPQISQRKKWEDQLRRCELNYRWKYHLHRYQSSGKTQREFISNGERLSIWNCQWHQNNPRWHLYYEMCSNFQHTINEKELGMNKPVIICGQYDDILTKSQDYMKNWLKLTNRYRRTCKYKNNIHGFNFSTHN